MLRLTRGAKIGFGSIVALVLLFMYLPLFLVIINSFNVAAIANWPISGFTFDWWVRAFNNDALWAAVRNSVIVATGATIIALLLGTMSAFALQRFSFYGKHTVNLLIVLPIALPGVVTVGLFARRPADVLIVGADSGVQTQKR